MCSQVPLWVRKESVELSPDNLDWTDRGTADGNSVQPDSDFGKTIVNFNIIFFMFLCLSISFEIGIVTTQILKHIKKSF